MVKKSSRTAAQRFWEGMDDLRKSQKEFSKEFFKGMKELRKSQKETAQQMQETDERLEKLAESINQANGNFNNKWGAFVERLVSGDLVTLLKKQGISVKKIDSRKKLYRENKSELGEIDIVAYNDDSIVLTEVKATLTKGKIDKFVKKLKVYKKIHPISSPKTIFGAMGFLEAEEGSLQYAEECGLFVIRSPDGEFKVSKIVNGKDFKPHEF